MYFYNEDHRIVEGSSLQKVSPFYWVRVSIMTIMFKLLQYCHIFVRAQNFPQGHSVVFHRKIGNEVKDYHGKVTEVKYDKVTEEGAVQVAWDGKDWDGNAARFIYGKDLSNMVRT